MARFHLPHEKSNDWRVSVPIQWGHIHVGWTRIIFLCLFKKNNKKKENYDVNIFCSLNFVQCTHMFVLVFFLLKFKEIQCFVSSIDVDYFFPVAFKYDNRDCIQLILKSSSRLFFLSAFNLDDCHVFNSVINKCSQSMSKTKRASIQTEFYWQFVCLFDSNLDIFPLCCYSNLV